MHITPSLFAFIFLGVAAARVIQGIALRDNASDGAKVVQGARITGFPTGFTSLPSKPESTILPLSSLSIPGVLDPETTGKHSHPPTSGSNAPTDIRHPSVSDHPKPTGSHSSLTRSLTDSLKLPIPSKFTSNGSDHPKPTLTSKHFRHPRPSPSSSDILGHPEPTAEHSRSDARIPHSHTWFGSSDRPEPTGKSAHPKPTNKAT